MSLKPAQGDAANGKDTRRPTAKSPLRTPTPATPPDGGWGWMIVVSSFMVSVLVDGVCFSAGIFFNPFRSYFGTTKAQTAWVGSVLNGSYLTIGPVVSAFVNRYGCRPVAMVGSVFAAAAFFLSTFSPSMPVLIITYGLLGGIGFGFVYLPAIVMVGYYFERRRALATGIACCGSGIGAFVFAPLCNFLLELYDWKGATWILSALVLNGLLFSVFYRPLGHASTTPEDQAKVVENGESSEQKQALLQAEEEEEKKKEKKKKEEDDDEEEEQEKDDDDEEMTKEGSDLDTALSASSGDHADRAGTGVVQTPSIVFVTEGDGLSVMRNVRSPASLASPTLPAPDVAAVPSGEMEERLNPSLQDVERTHSGESRRAPEKNDGAFPRISDLIQTVTPEVHRIDSVESKTFMSDFQLKVANPVARMAFSQDVVGPNSVKKRHLHASQRFHQQHHDRHHHHSHNYLEVDNPLQRKDIFYSGSLRHIAEYQSSENMAEYRQKVTMAEGAWQDEEEESGPGSGKGASDEAGVDGRRMRRRRSVFKRVVCDPLRHVFDVSLLRSPTFVIYGFSCFLCMLGFFVPFIYLPTLCIDLGIPAAQAAFLISIIGIANTVGRVVVGFVSDQPWADCLLINNIALVLGGAATCIVPLLGTYPLFAVYTYVFGSCIAIFVSLRSIIMVELMGLQKLTNAFGLVIMFQGISSFVGAPIAGFLSDITGNYSISFYVAGTFLGLGGLICFPLRRISRWERNRDNGKTEAAVVLKLIPNKSN